jgi:5-oxoprolinase (ATP-hydrolysing) subunit A
VAKTWIDLNSDMGEGLGIWSVAGGVDEAIMPLISSANIATGFHAGDPNIMARTVALARCHNVGVGAHPGYADLAGFGRRRIEAAGSELVNDVVYQLGALREFARLNSIPLTHLKLHGALYMHAAADGAFADELVSALQRLDPELPVFCMDQSKIYESACKLGQPTIREFFADRDYDDSGSIVFTRNVAAQDPVKVADKVVRACIEGKVGTVSGNAIPIEFETVCVHSDSPGALAMLQAIRDALRSNAIAVRRVKLT